MYFYEKGLKKYNYFLYEEEIISIPDDSFIYILNHDKKTLKKIDEFSNKVFYLDYKNCEKALNLFYANNTIKKHFRKIYTVNINGLPLQFEVNNDRTFNFSQDISIFNFEELPDFIKKRHYLFRTENNDYDIEWTGEKYQSQHYLFNLYFFSVDHKEIKKQILDFEKIIEDIPFEKEFYVKEGYEIEIIKTQSYSSIYPYSYKIIDLKNDTYIQGTGIPNHFEHKSGAFSHALAVSQAWLLTFLLSPL